MAITLITSNVNSKYISSSVKESVDQLRHNQNGTTFNPKDPAYTVELSEEARAFSNQPNLDKSESTSPSLFTKAGRTEVSQGYDKVFTSLLAAHEEDEAIQLFDEFMAKEGFERNDTFSYSITAPSATQPRGTPEPQGLSTHSHLTARVVTGESHILAATWATYNASSSSGNHAYRKKVSDSFDLAADTVFIAKVPGYASMQQGKVTDSQTEALYNQVDEALEKAATTGDFIDSTISEEAYSNGLEKDKNRVWHADETDLITVTTTRIITKSDQMNEPTYRSAALSEIKAKFRSLTEELQSSQFNKQL